MKFNIMIGGVETLFPEVELRKAKEKHKIVIFFLKIKEKDLIRTEKNMKKANLRIEENYLVLNLKDFQYAYDLNQYPQLMDLYMSGYSLGFAFEGEDGNILDIATPVYNHAV